LREGGINDVSYKVFIDGQEGTTGLKIRERLATRADIEVLEIAEANRKDPNAKLDLYRQSDVTLLCLPDQASREAYELTTGTKTRLIDASTAFRTDPGWVYGLPELSSGQRDKILTAKYVSNCGCYAAGFILAVSPLVSSGLIPADYPITCYALSGYSGGGKKLIETHEKSGVVLPPRPYALGLTHKHVPEMQKYTGLTHAPLFAPTVAHFYQGMLVSVPFLPRLLSNHPRPRDVHRVLTDYYVGEHFIRVMPLGGEGALDGGYLSPLDCNGTNRVDLFVFGNDDQILITARLDNLGKGASGTAVQCLNLMLGIEESTGLVA
jgi:N-acetyl-gamma-glutamyl-phosphate reductase